MKLVQVIESLTIAKVISLWIAIVIIFSILFFITSTPTIGESTYISFITATTIGYGEAQTGLDKVFVIIEAIISLAVFGIFIAKLVSVKQEKILEAVQEMSLEDATNNLITELYLFRDQIRQVKDTKDSKELDLVLQGLENALKAFNNASIKVTEPCEKSLMRISLLSNSLNHSFSKLVELSQASKNKNWKKESIAATLKECEQVTEKIIGHYSNLQTNEGVAEKLEDLNKTLTTLQKSFQTP